MNWRPISEQPGTAEPITALIATREPDEDEDAFYLVGIFMWRGAKWLDEDTGCELDDGDYWWLLESELLAPLQAKVAA